MVTKRKPTPELTDGQLFAAAAQVLFPGEDWQARFGAAFKLPKDTVRGIRRDHMDLFPELAAEMLTLIEQRAMEAARARDALKAWLKKNGPT
jgi:hypothetical protein